MKKKILLLSILATCITSRIFAQDGRLDSTFSDDGIVTASFGGSDHSRAVAVRPDGKVVVAGTSDLNNWSNFAVAQYNVNGTLDSTFGSDGLVQTVFSEQSRAEALAIQPDGKIVVAGGAYLFYYLARYNANGTLDSTFGSNGKVYTVAGDMDAAFTSIALQSDGKIVATGYSGHTIMGAVYNMVFARYNSDGSLDNLLEMFDGKAMSVTLQPDSKIIAAGTSMGDIAIVRFNNNFSLDNSFSGDGIVIISGGYARSVSIQEDQKIVVAAVSTDGFTLLRLNTDGALDNTFGSGGVVNTAIGAYSSASSVAVLQAGKIQVAGNSDGDFALARYNSDGSLDSSFAFNGIITTDIDAYYDYETSMAIQGGGNIVIAGSTIGAEYSDFVVARYISSLNVGIIDFSSTYNSVLIYPNPIKQNASLEYTLKYPEAISIRLLDFQGRTLKTFIENEKQEAGQHNQILSLPQQLPSASYIIVISSANSGSVSVKVVK